MLRAVLQYLNSFPFAYAFRQNTGKLPDPKTGRWISFGCPGSADVLAVCAGTFVAVECKSSIGTLRPGQKAWGARITRKGGLYIVARSVRDVEEALRGEP